MMKQFSLKGAAFAALFLFFASQAGAQLAIKGDPIREHDSKPGRTVKGEILVQNMTQLVQGGALRVEATGGERDMAPWVKIATPYFNVPTKTAIRIKYKVRIPSAATGGSYWCRFFLIPAALKQVGWVKVRTRLAGFLIVTVGGTVELKFTALDYKDGLFDVKVENTGTVAMRPDLMLYVGSQAYPAKKKLCFPGKTARYTVDAGKLRTGKHSVVAVAGDPHGAFGTRKTVEVLGVERIEKVTVIVPVRVRLSSDIGPSGLRFLTHMDSSFGRWRVGVGGLVGQKSSRFNFSLGYSAGGNLNLNLHGYSTTQGRLKASLGARWDRGRWMVSINTAPFDETGNASVRYRVGNGYLSVRASFLRSDRLSYSLTASMPFNFQLSFKRRLKQERAAPLETVIFNEIKKAAEPKKDAPSVLPTIPPFC